MTDIIGLLRSTVAFNAQNEEPKKDPEPKVTYDNVHDEGLTYDAVGQHEQTSLAYQAVQVINEWAETDTDDLDEGETLADRLMSLFVGIVDSAKDGDIDEDEEEVIETALNTAWDYLDSLGVSEADISSLLNDWDNVTAQSVLDQVVSSLPDGEEEADKAIDNFVFGEEDQGAVFDAVYRKKIVVRNGKKVRINKRISGKVRLSAKQKMAIRKMHRKSNTGRARLKRLRSMRVRKSMGK